MTDAPTLECVIDAVGSLRIAIEARLSMDMAASPMQGARLRVASDSLAEQTELERDQDGDFDTFVAAYQASILGLISN